MNQISYTFLFSQCYQMYKTTFPINLNSWKFYAKCPFIVSSYDPFKILLMPKQYISQLTSASWIFHKTFSRIFCVITEETKQKWAYRLYYFFLNFQWSAYRLYWRIISVYSFDGSEITEEKKQKWAYRLYYFFSIFNEVSTDYTDGLSRFTLLIAVRLTLLY